MQPQPTELACPNCGSVTAHLIYSAVAGQTEIRWCQSCFRVRLAGPGAPPAPAETDIGSAARHLGQPQP